MRVAGLLLLGILWVSNYAEAQGCMIARRILPDDLRPSLEERVSKFLSAEAEEHWDEVAELLGRCRFGCNPGKAYTAAYKECLVSRMQEVRMLDFDFSIQNLSACTRTLEQVGTPFARFEAGQLSWYATGTARFQTSSKEWREQTEIIAYRDQDQWYFTPPQWKMQHEWEKAHFTEADFALDRHEEYEILNSPSFPIEIMDVHAYLDREQPSIRNVSFKLRNKTAKQVRVVSVRIGDESGAVDMGIPDHIAPQGDSAVQYVGVSAYSDFCADGISKQSVAVEHVWFGDGSEWNLKRRGKANRNHN